MHGGVVVAVADGRGEPVLAGIVAEILAAHNDRLVLVANRPEDPGEWSQKGALCVPASRLGAMLVARGRRPIGGMRGALRGLALVVGERTGVYSSSRSTTVPPASPPSSGLGGSSAKTRADAQAPALVAQQPIADHERALRREPEHRLVRPLDRKRLNTRGHQLRRSVALEERVAAAAMKRNRRQHGYRQPPPSHMVVEVLPERRVVVADERVEEDRRLPGVDQQRADLSRPVARAAGRLVGLPLRVVDGPVPDARDQLRIRRSGTPSAGASRPRLQPRRRPRPCPPAACREAWSPAGRRPERSRRSCSSRSRSGPGSSRPRRC